ncbi:light-harvesting complex-like protein 3 isotype 1, chloroplastic [Syzygium oleosum]|uniref:light-harvesting complex-like protein 3 isotype 1, chloroplastic n=1 Tax=Syzygium oleosum TaxID=219896 RepID=UPI0024BA9634|nr:light-harvesting complex-like protein 3 isotype 1, chloroplastic [Syzygium oleosum]
MASVAISASLHRACSLNHVPRRQQLRHSVGMKQATNVVTVDGEGPAKGLMLNVTEHKDNAASGEDRFRVAGDKSEEGRSLESSAIKFKDERWTNGSWDLNMFVKDGKMDWDGVIVAGER